MKNFTLKFVLTVVLGWCFAFAAEAQTVRGVVKDAAGEPVIGAAVIVEGTTLGASTGVDGSFTLNVPDAKNNVLVVSYIGMTEKRVADNASDNCLERVAEQSKTCGFLKKNCCWWSFCDEAERSVSINCDNNRDDKSDVILCSFVKFFCEYGDCNAVLTKCRTNGGLGCSFTCGQLQFNVTHYFLCHFKIPPNLIKFVLLIG